MRDLSPCLVVRAVPVATPSDVAPCPPFGASLFAAIKHYAVSRLGTSGTRATARGLLLAFLASHNSAPKPIMRCVLTAAFFVFATAIGNAQESNFVSTAPEPSHYAWWLRTEFHPFEEKVRGIPVSQIRSTWCKATEFRKNLFPSHLASVLERGLGLSFSVESFFDGSKAKQTALLGVYESCAGERGTFLLVLAWPRSGQATIRFVHEMPTEHQFAVLAPVRDSTISVFHCLDCDHVTQFKWDKSKGPLRDAPSTFLSSCCLRGENRAANRFTEPSHVAEIGSTTGRQNGPLRSP